MFSVLSLVFAHGSRCIFFFRRLPPSAQIFIQFFFSQFAMEIEIIDRNVEAKLGSLLREGFFISIQLHDENNCRSTEYNKKKKKRNKYFVRDKYFISGIICEIDTIFYSLAPASPRLTTIIAINITGWMEQKNKFNRQTSTSHFTHCTL